MEDFRTMFPSLDRNVIETVLRANDGHVDSTIDQLLQLTQQSDHKKEGRKLYYTLDDSTDSSSASLSPELHNRLSSSEDDRYLPRYTPHAPNDMLSPSNFRLPHYGEAPPAPPKQKFRDWNPPLLGPLPQDFLRISSTPTHHSFPRKSTKSKKLSKSSANSVEKSMNVKASGANTSNSVSAGNNGHSNKPHRRNTTTESRSGFLPTPSQRHGSSSQPRRSLSMRHKSRKSSSASSPRHHNTQTAGSPSRSSFHNDFELHDSHHMQTPTRFRSTLDQELTDRRIALMLQNEEFLKELKMNKQFMDELNKDNDTYRSPGQGTSSVINTREHYPSISVDPLAQNPEVNQIHTPTNSEIQQQNNVNDDTPFKENLKHMSKAARSTFNDIARKFNRKKSYKSMNNPIDPVFANCDDND